MPIRPSATRLLFGTFAVLTVFSASAKDLTVSAAASLKDAFQEIGSAYSRQYPDVHIHLNTAGSGALVQQILQGAPVDVLATADQQSMDMAAAHNAVDQSSRQTFVRNDLVIAVPKGSRLTVKQLADLKQPAVKRIALSNPASVPAGRYGKAALDKAGLYGAVAPKIIQTQNVRQSLDYVARGEVDAGLVYRTDAALMADKVKAAAVIPTTPPVTYPIAAVTAGTQKAEALRFIRFVQSAQGRGILNKYGFARP